MVRLRRTFGFLLLVAGSACLLRTEMPGQSSEPPSLGEVARKNRATSCPKAKAVLTEDDVRAYHGPIPSIATTGPENTETIFEKIQEYRSQHTAQETEQAIHDWYDEQIAVIRDLNLSVKRSWGARGDSSLGYGDGTSYDPQKYAAEYKYQQLANANNQQGVSKRLDAAQRIREGLDKVSFELMKHGVRYQWFEPYQIYPNRQE